MTLCDMQSEQLENLSEWMCAQANGSYRLILAVHVGSLHALLGLIIVLHYL